VTAAGLLATEATPKGLRADAQRAVSPERTLERIEPLYPAIGLTRLADITGLDSLGIPVVLSVRPQSGYLSVDGGKGFTRIAAMASAAMECFERHAGERTPLPRFTSTYAGLPESGRISVADLPMSRHSLFSPALPETWVWAEDLLGGEPVAVPSVMVALERHRHARSSTLPFHFSSNGLNSGNTKSEALIGALYEVIERDATTCTKVSWESGAPMRRVDLNTAGSPDIAALVERIHGAGVEVVVVDCTVDTEVPTFCAYLCDLRDSTMGVYHGYGTHLDPEVAVIRAICEAAQGRLVFIAGSRDDSFRHHRRFHTVFADAHRILLGLPPTVDLGAYPDESGATFEADGRQLIGKLRGIGVERVLSVDLTHPDIGVDVFRVVVPGLEGYMLEDFTPGRRARRWARAHSPAALDSPPAAGRSGIGTTSATSASTAKAGT
jgi:ribosomal protein S12 methylthiotransferase accessory factor